MTAVSCIPFLVSADPPGASQDGILLSKQSITNKEVLGEYKWATKLYDKMSCSLGCSQACQDSSADLQPGRVGRLLEGWGSIAEHPGHAHAAYGDRR